jgi:hypothetical protein
MANLNENERECINCGCVFNLIYTNKAGYKYKINTIHCSKECSDKNSHRAIETKLLKEKALSFIKEQNEYCTFTELCKGTGHSNKTFTKHGLLTSDLNKEAGFDAPKSKFQDKIGEVLKQQFEKVETEKKFDGLVGTTGYPLRVDFYIPEINTVIEADGTQHSDQNHPWSKHKNGTVSDYDKIKDAFLESRGISLIRIPYKRNIKESDILAHLN